MSLLFNEYPSARLHVHECNSFLLSHLVSVNVKIIYRLSFFLSLPLFRFETLITQVRENGANTRAVLIFSTRENEDLCVYIRAEVHTVLRNESDIKRIIKMKRLEVLEGDSFGTFGYCDVIACLSAIARI